MNTKPGGETLVSLLFFGDRFLNKSYFQKNIVLKITKTIFQMIQFFSAFIRFILTKATNLCMIISINFTVMLLCSAAFFTGFPMKEQIKIQNI